VPSKPITPHKFLRPVIGICSVPKTPDSEIGKFGATLTARPYLGHRATHWHAGGIVAPGSPTELPQTPEIAVMGPEGAVNFVYRRELAAAADQDAVRRRKTGEFREQFANPLVAAGRGYVDDAVEPHETPPRIIRARRMLEDKVDTMPRKKHGNVPPRSPSGGAQNRNALRFSVGASRGINELRTETVKAFRFCVSREAAADGGPWRRLS
jgi:Carboxyl transferase domain